MPRKRANANPAGRDVALENFQQGHSALQNHPLFAPLLVHTVILRNEGNLCPKDGWAVVSNYGSIHVHPTRRGDYQEWMWVLAHCLLHLGFGHIQKRAHPREWNAACDGFVNRFLADLKLGRPPEGMGYVPTLPGNTEDRVYDLFCLRGTDEDFQGIGTAGPHANDMILETRTWEPRIQWPDQLAAGLVQAVTTAVEVAAGRASSLSASTRTTTPAQAARSWFISSYPLLGSLAATFKIIEDPYICQRMDISVAAVDPEVREVYFNPAAFSKNPAQAQSEYRFVMAHELLHVGLRHDVRREGRDPYLWNVSCDYIINTWLVEMGVGALPAIGALHDPELRAESAESLYDRIVTDLRRFRKLRTMRGIGASDVLERGTPDWWRSGAGVDLDEFYRRCLSQGLVYHEAQGRGTLPAGLVEEIQALSQPPIPWDVELARWFDHYFPPPERVQSYARPSRRQSATPDIPRPRWVPAPDWDEGRTFGVVLDTSGSMDRKLLAKALGAIASYSMSREVPAVRVVFCDAATYDQGYMPPEAVAETVRVRGRGGTILQPGIDLLENTEDFPEDGPLLIITDGLCDRLHVRREHAFLIPAGHSLPFVPKGPVFRID
jgi:predicted metal-dependent peptidase